MTTMKRLTLNKIHSFLIIPFFLGMSFPIIAQQSHFQGENYDNAKKWKFGGGLGLGFGSGYTDIMIAPSALYEVNPYLGVGVGLQGSYINSKNRSYYNTSIQEYSSWIYGGSLIAISNPIPQLQLSAELEQLRVNNSYKLKDNNKLNDDFWNTALFLGVGYNQGPVTIGLRYNVLYKEKDMVYGSAYMPFVRVYF
jgi:long-subunit fatty acid transport protein